jgi:hypothetical protein
MVMPRLLALSWSMLKSICGVSKRRSESEKMNIPLSFADFSTSATTSASCRKSCVVVMMNCTGGPPTEPGKVGGEKDMACAVARLEMRGDSSCSTCF